MTRKRLLYAAAFFTLFTFVGHSFGTLLPHPVGRDLVGQVRLAMENTPLTMPFGPSRTLADLAYGGNLITSLYLLVAGVFFILSAKPERYVKSLVILNSTGVAACAVISIFFFFPLPAACTALSAILGYVATREAKTS